MNASHERNDVANRPRQISVANDAFVARLARVYWQQDHGTTGACHVEEVRERLLELAESSSDADPAAAVRSIRAELLLAHEQNRVSGQYPGSSPTELDHRLQLAYRHLAAAEQMLTGVTIEYDI